VGQPDARPTEDPAPRKSQRRFNWRRGLRALLIAVSAIMGLFALGVASVGLGC
jgi:hypothetical protein